MCEGSITDRPGSSGGGGKLPGPVRQPDSVSSDIDVGGAGHPAAHPVRIGLVIAKVFPGLTISTADHGNVTGLCKSCAEND